MARCLVRTSKISSLWSLGVSHSSHRGTMQISNINIKPSPALGVWTDLFRANRNLELNLMQSSGLQNCQHCKAASSGLLALVLALRAVHRKRILCGSGSALRQRVADTALIATRSLRSANSKQQRWNQPSVRSKSKHPK